jgi:hypothetical protein
MNKCVLPFLCAAAGVALGNPSTPRPGALTIPSTSHFVGYFQQDNDSDVQTDSDSEGNYDVFYDRLSSDGQWLNDDNYGYVWQPNVAVSTSSWRPYSDGHWVWTDRGWFWESNENFGWATYHYGRWVLVDGTGWVWAPGKEWAPAWVSWRHTDNDDYVGWAPLPPESSFNRNVGVHPWADTYYDIGPTAFAFIRIADFARPSYSQYCLPQQQNLGFFNRTTNVTNIYYNNNVVNNYGPQFQRVSQLVQQQGGQQLPSYRINYAAQTQANAAFATSAQGNQLNVIAPPPTLRPVSSVKPQVARELGKTQVDRGWHNVPTAQAQQFRQQFVQQSPVPKELPPKPALPARPQIQAVTKGQQPPANQSGKGPAATPAGQLKPFVQKPEDKAAGEQKKAETEKPTAAQPESNKPGEPPKRPTAVTEEKKPGAESVPTEQPKATSVRKEEGERPQPNAEIRRPGEPAKPAGHGEPANGKKEDLKKVPPTPPQANATHKTENARPEVADAPAPQPPAEPPHAEQPRIAQPPAEQHRAEQTQAAQPPAEQHRAEQTRAAQPAAEQHRAEQPQAAAEQHHAEQPHAGPAPAEQHHAPPVPASSSHPKPNPQPHKPAPDEKEEHKD